MKEVNMSKKIIKISFVIIIVIMLVFVTNHQIKLPFDLIISERDFVESNKLISTLETQNGTLVFTAGEVNNGTDNMYFVDLFDKSFLGYNRIVGSGHINHDSSNTQSENYIFSAQLFEEDIKNPIIFGIIPDSDIKKIDITTKYGTFESVICEGIDNEKMYYILFDSKLKLYDFFINVTYENDQTLDFILGDKISKFEDGGRVYFYEDELEIIN